MPSTPIQSPNPQATAAIAAKPLTSPIPPEPLDAIAPTGAADLATPHPSASAVSAAGDWRIYHSPQGDFSVEYPADWIAIEQGGDENLRVTEFVSPGGNASISVMVQPGELPAASSDIGNVRCQELTIDGLSGMRCFDSVALSSSATLVGGGKTFIIAGFGKRLDTSIYQRLTDSLRLLR
jgi:hypothetical protein